MIRKRTLLITLSLFAAIIIGSSATFPQQDGEHKKAKNLNVLPKNISHDDLEKVMKSWNKALGVKCNHCHVARKDDPKKLDFVSDEKPEKEMARDMYKMTMKLNRKYFGDEKKEHGKATLAVNCNTCHRGHDEPEE